MTLKAYNISLLIGWLLVSIGACLVHPGYGLAASGALLLVLTYLSAHLIGLYAPKPAAEQPGKDGEA